MRGFVFSIMFFLAVLPLRAQSVMDEELASLVTAVTLLRTANEESYGRAVRILEQDAQWTPMNELGALQPGECSPADRTPGFKLNRILSKVDRGRKYGSVHGDMLNGEDERYHYSLYERSVKGGQSVAYALKGRQGKQTFVIVPYDGNVPSLSAVLTQDGGPSVVFAESGGLLVATCTAASAQTEIVITVTEKSGVNRAFVLLNHNSRK